METPSEISINDLPAEIYHFYLFNYLHIDEVLNLKFVCKNFYFVVKTYDIKELSFFRDDYYKDNWFGTTKSIRFRNQFHYSRLDLLKNPSSNLLNLKYLRSTMSSFQIQPQMLNNLSKLQVLQLYNFKIESNCQLKLHELKAFSISFPTEVFDRSFKFLIDCPNLHYLYIANNHFSCFNNARYLTIMDQIQFAYPLSIKHLKLTKNEKNMTIFQNLEILELERNKELKIKDLLRLKNLTKLRLHSTSKIHELKTIFESKELNIEIVLSGVKIKEMDKFDEFQNGEFLEFQMDNYNDLEDDLNFITYITYHRLAPLIDKRHVDLFKKLTNITVLQVEEEVKDEDQLIKFISECPNLYQLYVTIPLSQRFFDRLPDVSSLYLLLMSGCDFINFNFEFIKKMPYLKKPTASKDILISKPFDVDEFKKFGGFIFRTKTKFYGLDYLNKNGYTIKE